MEVEFLWKLSSIRRGNPSPLLAMWRSNCIRTDGEEVSKLWRHEGGYQNRHMKCVPFVEVSNLD